MKNIFYVGTEAQRIIFVHEMQGQLSDGYWENSRPYEHWKPWCNADVVVNDRVGRTFWAAKDNYDFTNADLLRVVGDRIIIKVKASMLGFDEIALTNMPASLEEYEDWVGYSHESAQERYWINKLDLLNAHGINAATMAAIEKWDGYRYKNLLQDCSALKTAARIML